MAFVEEQKGATRSAPPLAVAARRRRRSSSLAVVACRRLAGGDDNCRDRATVRFASFNRVCREPTTPASEPIGGGACLRRVSRRRSRPSSLSSSQRGRGRRTASSLWPRQRRFLVRGVAGAFLITVNLASTTRAFLHSARGRAHLWSIAFENDERQQFLAVAYSSSHRADGDGGRAADRKARRCAFKAADRSKGSSTIADGRRRSALFLRVDAAGLTTF